jgi:chemotaxis protein CheX
MSTAVAPPQSALNPKLILPFIASVRDVFRTMLGVEPTIERPRVKEKPGTEYDYSGIVAFSGNIVGTVVVSFHRDSAIKMVEKFAGSPIEPDTGDFADALGELTNMIAGAAKKDLGSAASISVPTVIMGRGHTIARPSDVPCLQVPCVTALGPFAVEIAIKTV